MPRKALTGAQVERFVEDGFVRLEQVVPARWSRPGRTSSGPT